MRFSNVNLTILISTVWKICLLFEYFSESRKRMNFSLEIVYIGAKITG